MADNLRSSKLNRLESGIELSDKEKFEPRRVARMCRTYGPQWVKLY